MPDDEGKPVFEGNVGPWDRGARLVAGIVMLVFGWLIDGDGWILALRVFALYPLVTGLAGWSPLYALLRIRTRPRDA